MWRYNNDHSIADAFFCRSGTTTAVFSKGFFEHVFTLELYVMSPNKVEKESGLCDNRISISTIEEAFADACPHRCGDQNRFWTTGRTLMDSLNQMNQSFHHEPRKTVEDNGHQVHFFVKYHCTKCKEVLFYATLLGVNVTDVTIKSWMFLAAERWNPALVSFHHLIRQFALVVLGVNGFDLDFRKKVSLLNNNAHQPEWVTWNIFVKSSSSTYSIVCCKEVIWHFGHN